MKIKKLLFTSETASEDQLSPIVTQVKSLLPERAILLLDGDLAAGKTTFTRLFCETYGLQMVQSPTYAIHQRYQNKLVTIDHLDLYRLKNEEEIETSGLWDLLQEKNNLVMIEWSERLSEDWHPLDRSIYQLQITQNPTGRFYEFFQLS